MPIPGQLASMENHTSTDLFGPTSSFGTTSDFKPSSGGGEGVMVWFLWKTLWYEAKFTVEFCPQTRILPWTRIMPKTGSGPKAGLKTEVGPKITSSHLRMLGDPTVQVS